MTELDAMLELWASRQRLTDEQAKTLAEPITDDSGTALGPAWWCEFTTRMTKRIVEATVRPVRFDLWVA